MAVVRHHYDWEWKGAEQEYHRTLELNPDYPGARLRYAWLLLSLSRREEALAEIQRAQQTARETDPHLLVVIRATRAAAFYFAREYDHCIRECQEAMELDSTHFLLHYLLARAHARKGALAKAGAILKKIDDNFDKIPLTAMGAGLVHAVAARKPQARAVLKRLRAQAIQRYIPATYIGTLYAATGETEAALRVAGESLRRAHRRPYPSECRAHDRRPPSRSPLP